MAGSVDSATEGAGSRGWLHKSEREKSQRGGTARVAAGSGKDVHRTTGRSWPPSGTAGMFGVCSMPGPMPTVEHLQ